MAKNSNNPRWMKVIESYLWSDDIPLTELAKKTNVPYDTIVRWFRDIDFQKALEKRYYATQTIPWIKACKAQLKQAITGDTAAFKAMQPIVEKNVSKVEGMISPFTERQQFIQINNISSEKEMQDPMDEVQNIVHTEVHEIPEQIAIINEEEQKNKVYTRPYKKQKVDKTKRNALMQLKRRAKKVGLASLGSGRPTRAERVIWLKRLEKLEEKAGIKHPSL